MTTAILSVADYHAMIRAGIFAADDRVELLEGWLVPKMSKSPRHSYARGMLGDLLRTVIGSGWFVDAYGPVTTDDSEPEPDLAVVRGEYADYLASHPGTADAGLLVEVADSTLSHDRGMKRRIYARAGFPVYWIVNLVDEIIEVYTLPSGPTEAPDYAQRQDFGLTESVPVLLNGVEVGKIAVREVLP